MGSIPGQEINTPHHVVQPQKQNKKQIPSASGMVTMWLGQLLHQAHSSSENNDTNKQVAMEIQLIMNAPSMYTPSLSPSSSQ